MCVQSVCLDGMEELSRSLLPGTFFPLRPIYTFPSQPQNIFEQQSLGLVSQSVQTGFTSAVLSFELRNGKD